MPAKYRHVVIFSRLLHSPFGFPHPINRTVRLCYQSYEPTIILPSSDYYSSKIAYTWFVYSRSDRTVTISVILYHSLVLSKQ